MTVVTPVHLRLPPVEFRLQGAPPNFLNLRARWQVIWMIKAEWFEKAKVAGTQARLLSGWEKAVEGEMREVTIVVKRNRLLDEDGLAAAVKPILDSTQVKIDGKSIKLGNKRVPVPIDGSGLIYRDDAKHLRLTPLGPMQAKVPKGEECVVVRVERL